jgi:hypothetical protein
VTLGNNGEVSIIRELGYSDKRERRELKGMKERERERREVIKREKRKKKEKKRREEEPCMSCHVLSCPVISLQPSN